MDFSTRLDPLSPAVATEAHQDVAAWLTRALGHVTDAGPADLVGAPTAWGTRPTRRPADAASFYPGGPNAHPFVELCIAVAGEAALSLEHHRFVMRPPRFAVVEPGRHHVEAYLRPERGYMLMWLSGCGRLTSMILSCYTPGAGWSIPLRRQLHAPVADRLNRLAGAGVAWMKPHDFEPLRQALLAVLCALHVQAMDESDMQPDHRRARRRGHRHHAMIEHIRQLLDEDLRAEFDLDQLAALARLTPNYLNTLFRRHVGQSIHAYRQARRMDEARRLLQRGDLLAKEVAHRLGFSDPLYFSRTFHRHTGLWPSQIGARSGRLGPSVDR